MKDKKALHRMIDDYIGSGGHPASVYDALAEAISETESHLESAWQERGMASVWRKLRARADSSAEHARKLLKGLGYKGDE